MKREIMVYSLIGSNEFYQNNTSINVDGEKPSLIEQEFKLKAASINVGKSTPFIQPLVLNKSNSMHTNVSTTFYSSIKVVEEIPTQGIKVREPLVLQVKSQDNPKSTLVMEPVSIVVKRSSSPIESNTSTGNGLVNLKYSFYKHTFVEIFYNFENTDVISVLGLPQDLLYDPTRQRIYGTINNSGVYNLVLKMSDGSSLKGIMTVYNTEREL